MSKSIVIVPLGRFNPPHKEHASLVDAVIKLAKSTNSDAKVFVSRTVNKKKDPLTPQEKIRFLKKMFPSQKKLFDVPSISNPSMIGVLKSLSGKYNTVHIVLGDDRVAEIKAFTDKYNGVDYNFEKIVVHSRHSIVNTRVGDLDGVHASDIRKWAMAGNFAKVKNAMSKNLTDADVKQIIRIIQSRLGKTMNESVIAEAEEEILLPSDAEITKMIEKMNITDLDLDDTDAMMIDLLIGKEEGDEEAEKEDVEEARILSGQARQKLAQRMKGMSKRLARLRQLKSKQMPAAQRLRLRARKAALMFLRKRATGKKDLDYSSLSRSQRIAVDTTLVQRFGKSLKGAINRIATRILPRIRSKAQASVAQARSSTNEAFHMFLEASTNEAFHMFLEGKEGKAKKISVSDANDSPLNIDPTKIVSTDVDPTTIDRSAPNPKHTTHGTKNIAQFRLRTEARSSAADAVDAGDTNIIYQMRKAIIARGEHEVVFGDKHKAKISVADARKMLDLFNNTRLPVDKQKLTIAAGKSLTAFRSVLSHGIPKDKPKISLGGKKLDEVSFNARNWNPNDSDAPPGITQANEKKKLAKEDSEDPNRSRRLNQKMDVLLRLGLVDTTELQGYRRALRSSKQFALQSPQLRKNLADLLDKLIDLTTQDPATYSRIRYNVVNKELDSQPNPDLRKKAKKSGVSEDVLNTVFAREMTESNNVNRAYGRVNSFIAGGFAAKLDNDLSEADDLPHKYRAGLSDKTAAARKSHWDKANKLSDRDPRAYEPAPGDANAKTKLSKHTIKYKKMYEEESVDESSETGLAAKADKSGISVGTLRKVYNRGVAAWNSGHRPGTTPQQWGMARVNSYITKGKGTYHGADKDLREDSVDEACWDTYKQVGMKKKGNRMVPNCVPENVVQTHANYKVVKVKKPDGNFTYRNISRNSATEATYKGKNVSLNKPMQGDVKKSKVYVDPDGDGKANKVNFGDKTMSIKKDQPARKKSYCARSSGQGNLTNKSSANYWSRRAWDC